MPRYQQAYALAPEPRLLLFIGRCQQKLGAIRAALSTYGRLRAEARSLDRPTRAELDAYEKEAELARSAAASAAASDERKESRPPLHRAWWVWTATGLAVSGVVIGLSVGLSAAPHQTVVWSP